MDDETKSFRVGLIGTGRISDIYLKNCSEFKHLEGYDMNDLCARVVVYGEK